MGDELRAFGLGALFGGLLTWAAVAPTIKQEAASDCVGPFAEGFALFFHQHVPREKQCR